MKDVLVIGSSNTDMVVRVSDIPRPGQTIMGGEFRIFAGGKGANQAVAARRAGASVQFIAAVGDDDFGRAAVAGFRSEGINTGCIEILDNSPSGVAMIFVSDAGENSIGVAPGANHGLTPDHLDARVLAFAQSSHVLLQLEIPMQTVEHAIRLAGQHEAKVILNPAPAAKLTGSVLNNLYCISPNETEAEELTGIRVDSLDSARLAAESLLAQGVQNVILTLGKQGALLVNADGMHHQQAEVVNVVDSTAAGDTFNGILAALLAEGKTLHEAIGLAVKGATLSVQRPGATDSIPTREQFAS